MTDGSNCIGLSRKGKLISMPELPDIAAYLSALEPRIVGEPLERVRVAGISLLRTAQPPLASVEGRTVRELRRIGKRIAIGLEGDLWLVLHLMIAGRLHWRPPGAKLAGRQSLAAFDFPNGSLVLTEAGTKRRASLHVVARRRGAALGRPRRHRCLRQRPQRSFAPRSAPRTTPLSACSPIRASSMASATPTRMKSCTRRNSRRSR